MGRIIERGRYTISKIPAEARLCTPCDLNAVENEVHIVLGGYRYAAFQRDLFSAAGLYIPGWISHIDDNKFVAFITSRVEDATFALAKWCFLATKQNN